MGYGPATTLNSGAGSPNTDVSCPPIVVTFTGSRRKTLSHRGLLRFSLVMLPLLGIRTPKLGYLFVGRHGHVLPRRASVATSMISRLMAAVALISQVRLHPNGIIGARDGVAR